MSLLFVYGSLKSGMALCDYMADHRYLGLARTRPMYKMYNLTAGFPALVEDRDGRPVWGELYEVSDFSVLDELEGVGQGYYRRGSVYLTDLHLTALPHAGVSFEQLDAKTADCYFWLRGLDDSVECPAPCWR